MRIWKGGIFMDIPVYMITGFLFGGKTTFLRTWLCSAQFRDRRVLLLLCEEGAETPCAQAAPGCTVTIRALREPHELTAETLRELQRQTTADTVVVEYNGMWPVEALYRALPDGWALREKCCCEDASMLPYYLQNMREQLAAHVRSCSTVRLNRCGPQDDRAALYRALRGLTQMAAIEFALENGQTVCYGEEEYNLSPAAGRAVPVPMADFPALVRSLQRHPEAYQGTVIRVTGQRLYAPAHYDGCLFGCLTLTYSVRDMDFVCLKCVPAEVGPAAAQGWVTLTARLDVRGGEPVLSVLACAPAAPPDVQFAVYA